MNYIDKNTFLRSFAVKPNGSLEFFLGAGASIQANIPATGTLIWQFKRKLYCQANNFKEEKFKDLESERNRAIIQTYFDLQGNYPIANNLDEYSFYFEKCYPNSIDRKSFIQLIVQGKNPSIGHRCLGTLFDKDKVHNIWTTNFDELIENGIKIVNNSKAFEVISPESIHQIANLNKYQRVIKLHGDYRYDKLQNTSTELQSLEMGLHSYFAKRQSESGLVVIGYSGHDKSILEAFKEVLKTSAPFPYGLYWCIRKGQKPNDDLIKLIDSINQKSKEKLSGFIEIDSFDDFLYEIYSSSGITNSEIENIANVQFEKRRPFSSLPASVSFPPTKLNGIKAKRFPTSVYCFKTDLAGWKELREITNRKPIQAALSKGNTLAFGALDEIKKAFGERIKSEIITADLDINLTYKQDSFYTGLLYDLIEQNLISKYLLTNVGIDNSRKYYSSKHPIKQEELDRIRFRPSAPAYEAIEIQIEFHNKELFVILLPTIYVPEKTGLTRFDRQSISNRIISSRYNKTVNESLNFWMTFLKNGRELIEFSNDSFKIELESNFCTVGINASKSHSFKGAFQNAEPKLQFHISDENYVSCHPLKGLKDFGPLDYSFESKSSNPQPIKIAVIATESGFATIIKHLNGLNEEIKPNSEKEYLIDYLPFSTTYKRYLEIPRNSYDRLVDLISEREIEKYNQLEFYDYLKRKIDYFYTLRGEFDVLVLYFPKSLLRFRELKNDTTYFDLHDSIKLYCAKNNIKIQFVEDKSIAYSDSAKVRWWLSLGLYVKANGTPWRNQIVNNSTAFIGLDFAIQKINSQTKYVLGSSQIFDSSGQGLRFLLQPIEHPIFYGRNPFMSKEDSRRLILKLKEAYFNIDGNSKLSKLVVHKVTHYTYDEMQGIAEAMEGVDNFELLQIQKYPNWRAIRGQINYSTKKPEINGFPIQRGTVIQLDDYSFLLWTHGSVQDKDVAGSNVNYYQGKRGIPSPLLVRRFRGIDSIETTVREILSLTKMNWNGGELYKTLPVTLDFSSRLSKYAKQAESLQPKAFDFRFFM